MNASPSEHRESSDTYAGEICREVTPCGTYRVIVCRDGIQWIIQRLTRASGGPHRAAWRAERYVTTREVLARLWADRAGGVAPEIAAFPDRIRRNSGKQ